MTPDTISHLLLLCAMRRAEIAISLRLARDGRCIRSHEFAALLAEQAVNARAVAELQDQLQLAAA